MAGPSARRPHEAGGDGAVTQEDLALADVEGDLAPRRVAHLGDERRCRAQLLGAERRRAGGEARPGGPEAGGDGCGRDGGGGGRRPEGCGGDAGPLEEGAAIDSLHWGSL